MRAVVQRVNHAQVSVEGTTVGKIDKGLCVFVGVMEEDTEAQAQSLARKVAALRVFTDDTDKMNLSVVDVEGCVLAVSQFTLAGDVRRGNRPAFTAAKRPDEARLLFENFCEYLRAQQVTVETGRFQTDMRVLLENDGPVTILLDTARVF